MVNTLFHEYGHFQTNGMRNSVVEAIEGLAVGHRPVAYRYLDEVQATIRGDVAAWLVRDVVPGGIPQGSELSRRLNNMQNTYDDAIKAFGAGNEARATAEAVRQYVSRRISDYPNIGPITPQARAAVQDEIFNWMGKDLAPLIQK